MIAINDAQLTDQQGIGHLMHLLSKKGCIVNECSGRETGIDAICEFRTGPYESSGIFLAIQLKTGSSYFSKKKDGEYCYYADDKHVDYWLKCNMPVLFIIYNPESEEILWTKIEKGNLVKTKTGCRIDISPENRLGEIDAQKIYEVFYGKLYSDEKSFDQVIYDLEANTFRESDQLTISGLELFINGMCNNCHQLYFHTELYSNLMDYKAISAGMGGFTYPNDGFFEQYFATLNYHNLLAGTFEQELNDINARNLIPYFIKYLSPNGLAFIEYLRNRGHKIHDRLFVASSNFVPYIIN